VVFDKAYVVFRHLYALHARGLDGRWKSSSSKSSRPCNWPTSSAITKTPWAGRSGPRCSSTCCCVSGPGCILPMGGREKVEVFLLNLGNKIYFTAADNQASEMIANANGKHTVKKRTYGRSAGKSTMS
jgi:hypothetical protein